MTTTPIVALQKTKEISLNEIESELSQIWHFQNSDKGEAGAVRAATFSMVVYEPEEFQQLLAILGFYRGAIDGIYAADTKKAVYEAQKAYGLRLTSRVDTETLAKLREEVAKLSPEQKKISNPNMRGYGVSDAIAVQNPCRIISLCPSLGDDENVTTQVSVSCPLPLQRTSASLICCEYITLRGSKAALNRIGEMVAALMIADLPKFVWWKATPNPEQELFKQLVSSCNGIILDSSYFSDPESEFLKIHELVESGTSVVDLNWHRISAWQELSAEAYDPPERRQELGEIDQIAIDYEKGNAAQALMYLGWIASRLGWEPVSYTETGGDYELRHVHFTGSHGRPIVAELAAIPTADSGEIVGDLIGLRMTSTNLQADCCTILCSETTGCMRMEAGGSAQACRTELVTAINDQRAELLLSQQLQRWGQDVLYEESLAVVNQILMIRSRS
jgi:glucose-6-phosphate dehydrogenase assembly protein OpcA